MAYSSQMVQLVILPDEAMANITFNAVSKDRNCLTFKDIKSAWNLQSLISASSCSFKDIILFLKPNLQIQSYIDIPILTTEEAAILVSASACSFKTSVAVEIIFYVVSVIEVIADYFTVFPNYNIATVGIIPAVPFLCRSHSQCSVKKKNLHLMLIESRHILTSKGKWVFISHSFNGIFYV